MKRIRFFWWMVAGPIAVLVAMMAVAFPWLALTERSGGDVLVVEGWLERPQLKDAVAIARTGGYSSVHTTGSIRPFAYYLENNGSIDVRLASPVTGHVRIDASGLPGAGFILLADADTLTVRFVTTTPAVFETEIKRPTDHLRFLAITERSSQPGEPVLFVKYLNMDGVNIHYLQVSTLFISPSGTVNDAWPTYAHKAAHDLIELGLPAQQVHAVPSWGRPDSRSWANANYFAVFAREHGIRAFDVASLGVHARRSRDLYQRACGEGYRVGVISIRDPRCPPKTWWRKPSGWVFMLKEIFGSSEAIAVDLTR
jgi:hypothetical protein